MTARQPTRRWATSTGSYVRWTSLRLADIVSTCPDSSLA